MLVLIVWGYGQTRFNRHTPNSAAGTFCAWCCGYMVVACMVSLIYTNILRERCDTAADDNDKMPQPPTTISRGRQQQRDAANDK